MKYPVEIRRSRRRTISLSVEKDLRVLVKAPSLLPDAEVRAFVEKHEAWIEEHVRLRRKQKETARSFSREEIAKLAKNAWDLACAGIRKYARIMGVVPAGVKITSAVTRWGSCSGKDRLCFSYRIALLPQEAVDYIVVHELAHIRRKDHSPRFYAEVAAILPDYKRRVALLRQTERELGL